MTGADLSRESLEGLAGYISFLEGAWRDFGYEMPPTPECKPVPPLGERSAEAIKSGHEATEAIGELTRRLYALRERLVGELRQDSDIRGARVDAMLAARRAQPADTVLLTGLRTGADLAGDR